MAGGENENQLIGLSPNEILQRSVEDIKSLSLKRRQESSKERYNDLLRKMAKDYFMLSGDDVKELSREQKIALEYSISQKAKSFNRIWLWSNVIGLSAAGILAVAVSPFFLLGLIMLLFNLPVAAGSDEPEFRELWLLIHQSDDPKELLKISCPTPNAAPTTATSRDDDG